MPHFCLNDMRDKPNPKTVIIIGKINAKQQIWYQLKINFDKTTKF